MLCRRWPSLLLFAVVVSSHRLLPQVLHQARARPSARAPATACSAEKESAEAEESSWRSFEAWLKDQGCTAEAVELAHVDAGLRGVRTTRCVEAFEELVRIPRNIILSDARAEEGVVGGLWKDEFGNILHLPAYSKLALQILYEQRLGDDSEVATYIALLPTPEDFEGYAPASIWTDDELALTECEKFIANANYARDRLSGHGNPCLKPETLTANWKALGLPGEPPTQAELDWATTAVTSRAFSADTANGLISCLPPMADMMNHGGTRDATHTLKYLEPDGGSYVVLAKEPMQKHEQVFLCYGDPLPNFLLLNQFGFVLPDSPVDVGLVRCDSLISAAESSALEAVADEGLFMLGDGLEADNAISLFQPAGEQLQAALFALAEDGKLPDNLLGDAGAAQDSAEARAMAAYRELLKHTLDAYSTTLQEDQATLADKDASLPPRTELALQFRASQKKLLLSALATSVGWHGSVEDFYPDYA